MDTSRIVKELGLKATPKRIAILEILAEAFCYLGPEEIWRKLQVRFKRIGLPTVYRNLEELSNGGVIIKIIHPNRKLYYYYCNNTSHHHHFVCIACRRVQDLEFCGEEKIIREVEDTLKGKVVSHLFQVYGLCSDCTLSHAVPT
ncbi:MAG: Fur family transcriptional regulator [Syntrophorhabdus sp.]